MGEQQKKPSVPVFLRLLAAIFALLVFAAITGQIALWGGVLWLRSAGGEVWLESSLSRLAAESGYALKIDGIGGLTLGGVNIRALSLADKDGALLEAEEINMHVGVLSLFSGSVFLSGGAESLTLHRLPNSSGDAGTFSLPDMYFHALYVDALDIRKLSLDPAVMGRAAETAASISGEAAVHGQDISLALSLKVSQEKDAFLPEKIDAAAVFSPKRNLLTVSKLAATSKVYDFKGAGTANMNNGALDFRIDGGAVLPESGITADVRVTGTSKKPAFAATGVVRLASKEPGDIRFTAVSDDTLSGHTDLATTWRKNDTRLSADFSYADGTLRLKNIRGAGPGISVRGKATVVLSAQNDLQSVEVSLDHAAADEMVIERLDATLARGADKSAYALSLDAKGVYQTPFSLKGTADLEGDSAETAVVRNIALVLHPSKGLVEVTGSVTQKSVALVMTPKNLTLGALPLGVPDILAKLEMTGAIHVDGPPAAPSVKAALDSSPLRLRKNTPSVTMHLAAAYADGKAAADISAKGQGIRTLQAHAEMPIILSLYPFSAGGAQNTGLRADVAADLELKSLAAAFLPTGTTLTGNMKADIKTSGAWDNPDMSGNISLSGGSFTQAESGVSFKGIEMRAALDDRTLDIKILRAHDQKNGAFSAQGKFGFGEKNMPADLSIQADGLAPFRASGLISGVFSGDISLKGDSRGYKVGGKITAGRVDVAIPERLTSAVPTLNIVRQNAQDRPARDLMKNVSLNLRLVAENHVFVRGWGLDAEFGGTLDVGGSLAGPLYTGQLESRRGRYEEFGKRFELQRALLRFEGAMPPSPYLDVVAATSVEDITAQINLTGNISKPEVKLSSVPVLPQDEVLSRILFGKDMTKISPFQAIQLANTLRRFSGKGGGFEPLGMFRKATGLDDLQVGKDEKGTTTVGAGKYITDKVYLEAEAGSGENSGAAKVKIDLTPHVKAESKIGQDNKTGGGLMWQWDY